MESYYNNLVKKILNFWKKYEGEELTVSMIRKEFDTSEIGVILDSNLPYSSDGLIISELRNRIRMLDNLLTESEALSLISEGHKQVFFIKYFGDLQLLSLLSKNINFDTQRIISYLSSDEGKLLAYEMIKNKYLKRYLICSLDSDETKKKYLRYFSLDDKSYIVASLKDEVFKEHYLNVFTGNKGVIIQSFKDDDKKIFYLKKYFNILFDYDKINIIRKIADERAVLELLKQCSDRVRSDVSGFGRSNEFIEKVASMIKSKKELFNLLLDNCENEDLISKYIYNLKNTRYCYEVIIRLLPKQKIKYLDLLNDKKKILILKQIYDGTLIFKGLRTINNKHLLFEFINHCDFCPTYSDEYEWIIDLYSKKYHLNKERLLIMVKNTSLSLLKVIENQNIMNLLNASDASFNKVMMLFKSDSLKMDYSSMNDVINAFLQREFRITENNTIMVFPNILSAIQNGDRNQVIKKIQMMIKDIDINSILDKNHWSLNDFIELLMNKNEEAINCLHDITINYIIKRRNEYIQNNKNEAMIESTKSIANKNDLMKVMINNYPVALIFAILLYNRDIYSEEELYLLNNKELFEKIILYKRNPSNYPLMPDDIKANIRLFNKIFETFVNREVVLEITDNRVGKQNVIRDVDREFVISVLLNLEVDKLEKTLFNNQELFDELLKIWRQYKIGGWGGSLSKLQERSGISFDAETVASLIKYFEVSYKYFEEKKTNMTLTSLLDLAACYSISSKKYEMLFGREDYRLLASNPQPNASSMKKNQRMEKALDYLKTIRKRNVITVPPLDEDIVLSNEQRMNVVVGNFSNPMNLTYGERTGACMRIGGAGSSLFDFCLENENGFHIRFTNPKTGKFVSRVSGFRNGNTIFLNELRYSEDYSYSDNDVVEACQMVARRIIELSKDSSYPIDNVVISPFYAIKNSNLSEMSLNINNPQAGLREFYIDVSSRAVVLATSSKEKSLVPIKLGVRNLPKYPVQRDKQKILYGVDCQKYVAHLKYLDAFLTGKNLDELEMKQDDDLLFCLAGEDWYVAIDNKGQIKEFIMNNSHSKDIARKEIAKALIYLKENLSKEMETANSRMV